MPTRIKRDFAMNLLAIFSFVVLFRSYQSSSLPLKSFTIGGNVTYDCVDINKQPGLDHPLLKHHKIQMQPSVSQLGFNSNTTYVRKNVGCPYGTVPILRNPKQFSAENHIHPLSPDNPGKHIVGVRSNKGPFRGVAAWFDGHNLNVGKDQASYSQIYIGSGLNKQINFISAGLMINPGFYQDGRVWKYGFWQGKDGKGCYNTACQGFVQVSHVVPIVEPFDLTPHNNWLHTSIHQDKNTGHWWLTELGKTNVHVGYWPNELFNLLSQSASSIGVGGVVQASPSGSSPPMGNGKFPIGARLDSSLFTNVEVLDFNYKQSKINSFPIDLLVDSPNCYGFRIGTVKRFHYTRLGYFFNYGGPGGNSCGI